jgi:PAS domain S-box-containing protein
LHVNPEIAHGERAAKKSRPDELIDLLLVDDRPENLLTLEAVLASPGYRLVKANSGPAALRYLLDHEPAVILMDVQMPQLDGFETASLIKRSKRAREIPIIFLTAIPKDEGFTNKVYAYGAVDYLHKPFDPIILRSKVAVFAELARKSRRQIQAEKALLENAIREHERQLVQLELRGLKRERLNQEKYRDLVEGIQHGIVWSADPVSLAISFVSPSAKKILGFPIDQWTSELDFIANRLYPDERQRVLSHLLSIREGEQDEGIEHRFRTASGSEVWMHTGVRLAPKGEAGAYELRALSVDITRIKQAEETLLQNKRHSDFLADASLLLSESLDYEATLNRLGSLAVPRLADWYSVSILDTHGNVRTLATHHSNPSQMELAKSFAEGYPADLQAPTAIGQVLRTGRPLLLANITETFLTSHLQDAEQRRVVQELGIRSAIIVPLLVRGRTFGTLAFMSASSGYRYNESDLRLAEDLARRAASAIDNAFLYQEAQKAIRTRDEFLSIASHELKTPITPLKIQIQGLMRIFKSGELTVLGKDRLRRMLESSERQLRRLTRLIDDLLDISRIDMGRLALSYQPFDLAELAHEVLERFSDQLQAAQCSVRLELESRLTVNWDRFRIEKVIINLLTNAMKYGQGSEIQISSWQEGNFAYFQVRDQGIGIASEDLNRIFERFERAVSGSHYGGLGLGLYIVRQVVAAHQGSVSVQSELGQGSTFTVAIPFRPDNSG